MLRNTTRGTTYALTPLLVATLSFPPSSADGQVLPDPPRTEHMTCHPLTQNAYLAGRGLWYDQFHDLAPTTPDAGTWVYSFFTFNVPDLISMDPPTGCPDQD